MGWSYLSIIFFDWMQSTHILVIKFVNMNKSLSYFSTIKARIMFSITSLSELFTRILFVTHSTRKSISLIETRQRRV